MFRGTLPPDAVSMVADIVKAWDVDEIFVGCSGNLTIERAMHSIGIKNIRANDVTIYSCALGRYFAGEDLGLSLREDIDERYRFMQARFADRDEQMATVMMISKYAQIMYKSAAYYEQMRRSVADQWNTMIDKTVERLASADFRLTSFYAGDVVDFIDQVPYTAGFVAFPPFFKGDYEKMHENIASLIAWEPPAYELLGGEGIWEVFKKSMAKEHWAFGTMHPKAEFSDHLVGICKTTNRGVPIYIYANRGAKRIVNPSQKIESIQIPRIKTGIDLGDDIKVTRLSMGQFSMLRSQYMNVNIVPGSPNTMWGVVVGGYLIGCFAYSMGDRPVNGIQTPYMYMLSDFPVDGSDYPRLSKLIVYAALSREMKDICEMQYGTRMRGVLTTAFSNKPVSMKYRGIMDLISRKDTDDGRLQLNYGQEFGKWTLREGLDLWKKKHGERRTAP